MVQKTQNSKLTTLKQQGKVTKIVFIVMAYLRNYITVFD